VILVVVVVAVFIVASLATLVWFTSSARFTCPGVVWTIDYTGSGSAYFPNNPPTGCLGYPLTGPAGFEILILVTLTNSAASASHQVTAMSVAYPTSLTSISPTLPFTLAPSATTNVTLNVTIPTLTGDYVVHGVITTS
jgi:hypothetical protein